MQPRALRDVEQLVTKILHVLVRQITRHFLLLQVPQDPGRAGRDIPPEACLGEAASCSCRCAPVKMDRQPAASACAPSRPQQARCRGSRSCAQCCPDVAHQPNPRAQSWSDRPCRAWKTYWQSVQRKEAISVAPIARRRTSILAQTVTFGLVLIVTGGTLGYRWTHPQMTDEVTAPAQEAREVPPTTSPPAQEAREVPPTTSPMPAVPRV